MKSIKNLALGAGGAAVVLFAVSLASSSSAPVPAPADQEAFINVAESTVNGVVSVKSFATPRQQMQQYYDPFGDDPFFQYFFGGTPHRQQQQPQQKSEQEQRQIGLGSGVIISEDGYIVTNNHVIEQAERLEITLNDNRSFNATVIGADPTTDLALIKIEADDLHVIPMGNSDDLHLGEWVLAVGNPLGLTSTVTSGIVSAKGRNLGELEQSRGGSAQSHGIESYIQTDAALNAGNSGGALVNLKGELVGINAALYSPSGQYTGYSFAIPTSIVTKVINDLKEYGTVQRAMLGIRFGVLTPEIIKDKNIQGVNAGIYVGSVEDQSAAKEAGIQEGDVIVAINDNPTTNTAQIQEVMAKCSPGDKVNIVFYRDGKRYEKSVTLRNGRGNTEVTRAGNVTDLGCAFSVPSKETMDQLGISYGVQVKGLESGPMKEHGVREGFIIQTINNVRVSKVEDVEKIYNSLMKDESADKVFFLKGIYPTGKTGYYAVPLND